MRSSNERREAERGWPETGPGAHEEGALQHEATAMVAGVVDGTGTRGKRAGDDRKGAVPDVQAEAVDRVMKTPNPPPAKRAIG